MRYRLIQCFLSFGLLVSCTAGKQEEQETQSKSAQVDVQIEKAALVGSWQFIEAKFGITARIHFNPDSSLNQRVNNFELNGTWQWLNDSQVRVYYPEWKKTEYWNFKFPSDSTLAVNRGLENKTTGYTIYHRLHN